MSQSHNAAPAPPGVTAEVQNFYDRYPYPPPLDNLEAYRQAWHDPQRRHADFHLFWPNRSYREDRSILVAGCGTSQAPKHAMRWPSAQVTGVDFSATSMQHSEELKRKYKLPNLELRQLPLERVGELGKSFDQIVCTGVLHHLADPNAGLRALRGALNPEGAIHLMVYAPYGRRGIYMLQEFCRLVGIAATDSGIRDLLVVLKALPSGHPLASVLREAPDFRNHAALADALLHPQDRAYSVPQLFNLLNTNRLKFGRWLRQAPYSIHCGVMSRIPDALRMAQLPLADQYAAAELFRGTMMRHSAVVFRDDHPDRAPPITFSGEEWLGYVPIRVPDTVCLRERLPAGVVAVLSNPASAYADIYLPINARETRLFEAIDGKRTIAELLGQTAETDAARSFFERLWWHDQIVFDASRR